MERIKCCANCTFQCEDDDGYGVQFVCHKNGRKNIQTDGSCPDFEPCAEGEE